MYKIIKYFDEKIDRDIFSVVNKQTNQVIAKFKTYDEAHSYVCSIG